MHKAYIAAPCVHDHPLITNSPFCNISLSAGEWLENWPFVFFNSRPSDGTKNRETFVFNRFPTVDNCRVLLLFVLAFASKIRQKSVFNYGERRGTCIWKCMLNVSPVMTHSDLISLATHFSIMLTKHMSVWLFDAQCMRQFDVTSQFSCARFNQFQYIGASYESDLKIYLICVLTRLR